jgi:NADP-dependent 3-hydroxy acid dehydrogenase YdfG
MNIARRLARSSKRLPLMRSALLDIPSSKSSAMPKLAVITGGNKGIGFEIAKAVAAAGVKCIIAARTAETAENAVHEIRAAGGQAEFRRLDLALQDSINSFVDELQQDYEVIDILVNNAGIAFNKDDPTPFPVQVEKTLQTNFWGTVHLTHALLPMVRRAPGGARIVFVASGVGRLDILKDENKKRFISKRDLTKQELFDFMNEVRYLCVRVVSAIVTTG